MLTKLGLFELFYFNPLVVSRHAVACSGFTCLVAIIINVLQISMTTFHQDTQQHCRKVEDPHCPFCANIDQTVTHLFSSCPIAISFWSDFIIWYQSFSQKNLSLSDNEILYCVLNGSSSCSTLNHLILIGKYFLYCKALNNVKFQFADFTNLVYDKIETERYIAIMSNKYNTFFEKWSNFITNV